VTATNGVPGDGHPNTLPGAVGDSGWFRERRLSIPVDDASLEALLVMPSEVDGECPALVLLGAARETVHGNEHIEDLARRFAALGFLALAPNLYGRTEPPAVDDADGLLRLLFELDDGQLVADLTCAAAVLRGLQECNGRVAVVGFCTGGRQALLAACSSTAFDAAVDCWGGFIDRATFDEVSIPTRPVPVIDLAMELACPLLAVGGADDDNPSPAVLTDLKLRLDAVDQTAEVHVYEGAGHAFLNDRRDTYRDAPAHLVWAQISGFLQHHLSQ
jgi:carboxymethylenebutenolidase